MHHPSSAMSPERVLAARVEQLRIERGMSYEALANRMREQGISLDKAAVQKSIKGDPPRRIVVDEMAAYARVFGVEVVKLLIPPAVVDKARLQHLLDSWRDASEQVRAAREVENERLEALAQFVQGLGDDEVTKHVIGDWITETVEVADSRAAYSYWMYLLTEDEQYRSEAEPLLVGDLRKMSRGLGLPRGGARHE